MTRKKLEKVVDLPILNQADVGYGNTFYYFSQSKGQASSINLVEIAVWAPQQGHQKNTFPVWSDLRISDEVIVTNDWRIKISLTGGEVSAELDGCSIEPGSRLGDEALPQNEEVIKTDKEERQSARTGSASGAISANVLKGMIFDANLKGESKTEIRSKSETINTTKIVSKRVSAQPNNRWKIKEPFGYLQGTYLVAPSDLQSGTPLFIAKVNSKYATLSLTFSVNTDDIDLSFVAMEESKWPTWSTKEKLNKSAVVKILLSKAHVESTSTNQSARVHLARSGIKIEKK